MTVATDHATTARARIPYLSVAMLSACALGYEILLVRLFAISQWHHFAYMVISLALLGYGVSGSAVTLWRRWLLDHFDLVFPAQAVLFSLTAVLSFLAAQRLAFNPEELLWTSEHWWYLCATYTVLSAPFFFAANAVALALAYHRHHVGWLYATDLVGAGLGSAAVVLALYLLMPHVALQLYAGVGALAALCAVWELGVARFKSIPVLGSIVAFAALALVDAPQPSAYKPLAQLLEVGGTRISATRSSPLGLIQAVESSRMPLRHAPGLSLRARGDIPGQVAVFTDADAMSVITAFDGETSRLEYLDWMTSALPYHLRRPKRVAVLGAGGGAEVLQARYHGVESIEVVELNPQVVDLVRNEYRFLAGGVFDPPTASVHTTEARGYIAADDAGFDLIQLTLVDAFGASSAGLYALSETYLYTFEALQTYLQHLRPHGWLAITRWVKLPPRDTLKLLATAEQALRRGGVEDPEQRLVLVRGWQTSTLLVKNGPVNAHDIDAVRDFCAARAFDVAYFPGIQSHEVNRYNVLAEPYFHQGALALLGPNKDAFVAQYRFDIRPATDDRPYFFHFLRWETLNEAMAAMARGGVALVEWGYLVVVATLVQALVVGSVLIMLPLIWQRGRQAVVGQGVHAHAVLAYFVAIGLGFLFVEMTYLQRAIQLVHHPTYAVASTVAAFLIFAGFGSAWSARLSQRRSTGRSLVAACVAIAVLSLLGLAIYPAAVTALASAPFALRLLCGVAVIAPLAFAMGLPFPLAMARLGREAPAVIPWAWGVNGCASVLSAVLATLVAVHAGFSTVVLIAALLYLSAGAVFAWGWRPSEEEPKKRGDKTSPLKQGM